jgi:hypothetical protein
MGVKEIAILAIILGIGYWLGTNDALAKFTG